jgi:hypothetical protein
MMLTFLCFLLAIVLILMAVRIIPLAFFIGGCWWLWNSHPWVLVTAIVFGALLGSVRALRNQSEPLTNHLRHRSTDLPTRHGIRRRIRRPFH